MTIYIEVQNHGNLVYALMLRVLTVNSPDLREYKKWNETEKPVGC